MPDSIFIGLFSVIMVAWNIYLMRQNNTLVNKLMSRNYGEYVTAETFAKPEAEEKDEEALVPDPYDKQRAQELNGMLGLN